MTFGTPRGTGWIEVICGGMFSGKTEELIRRLRRAQIARQRVAIFKPIVDDRYAGDRLVTHDRTWLPSIPVRHAREILEGAGEAQVLGIDEVQFFDRSLVGVCQQLAALGKRVIAAGLDLDYRGRPFEPVPELMAVAEYVTKVQAVCVVCGNPASRTQRVGGGGERILVGGREVYEPRCRRCFEPPEETSGDLFGAGTGGATERPEAGAGGAER
ncbi:MAG: thymidine kinase [Candidatus Eisenbacteria bacterium]|uniref:Thymidine kinase n=1 Tax=Eiseniibacteriota bacterium TaxID=2212470 RepID=A0A938BPW9_UNCEI|nr:thymidine kinase [Candidatus Eisenbacteria bacterium]